MTGSSAVADTNIFIDLMKGDEAIAKKLESFDQIYLSPVVLVELYFGAYRSANPATAIQHQLPLYTNDKHFSEVENISLV